MNKSFTHYWGIDVSKDWLDVCVGSKTVRIDQKQENISQFIEEHFKANTKTLAVLESTGGYELLMAQCLNEQGVTVHIAHPNKVRNFAKAKGKLAKTDVIDAQLLAAYGQFIEPESLRPLRTELELKLLALNSRLVQIKQMHHQESCRLGMARLDEIKEMHVAMLEQLAQQKAHVESLMRDLIASEPELQQKYELLQTFKGVGPTIALTLIAALPELGESNKKEIAALVGVAPITKDSGKRRGYALTQNGRHDVRRVLYMGALTAIRYDERMQQFYNRLIAKGKAKKVGIVAVIRKMLVIMNAMIIKGQAYNTQF